VKQATAKRIYDVVDRALPAFVVAGAVCGIVALVLQLVELAGGL
jgi:flagellar motor component MotA